MNEQKNDNAYAYEFHGTDQYETLIAAIPGGIVITAADEHFTVLFANQGYYDMVGYTREELLGLYHKVGLSALHPEDAQRVKHAVTEQMQQSGSFSVKAKLCHKTKGYIWGQFSGKLSVTPAGETHIYIVIVDASEQQAIQEKLDRERSFTELIATLSEEYFFDCDLLHSNMSFSQNLTEKLESDDAPSDYVEVFRQLGLLTAQGLCQPTHETLEALSKETERELCLTKSDGEEIWFLCRCMLLRDDLGVPIRIVGKLTDITRHKLKIDELSHLAQRDHLTGLLNKIATESRIKDMLKMRRVHDDNCALLIIDIDNFKNVNDRLGHLYGDAVLTQLAENLKTLFRGDDIVGRVGGDEFFVFLKSYTSPQILEDKAQEICNLFHKTYSEGDAFVTISASIGIALCPQHGKEFDVLYRNADAALYDVKAAGKNAFAFYTADSAQQYTSERTEIDSNTLRKNFKDNRIEYVFRLLYNSGNPASSIQAVLQLVTESYAFSRGYIFETSLNGKETNNTFEWCAKGISAEIQNLQHLPIEAVGTANSSFLKNGMFILESVRDLPTIEREVLEPQGILSMFQFGIMDMGELVGFIGFDDCLSERIPTDAEIDEICTVCHVLATFLLKHRSNEREIQRHAAIEKVMDHLHASIYVIDADDHSVLFENKTKQLATGSSSMGKACYVAYHDSEAPCENCPAGRFAQQEAPAAVNPGARPDLSEHTEVMPIRWSSEKTAYLICRTRKPDQES